MNKNLHTAIEALSGEIEFLQQAITGLDNTLSPVIVPDRLVKNTLSETQSDTPSSILTYRVIHAAEAVKEQRVRVEELNQALDLPQEDISRNGHVLREA